MEVIRAGPKSVRLVSLQEGEVRTQTHTEEDHVKTMAIYEPRKEASGENSTANTLPQTCSLQSCEEITLCELRSVTFCHGGPSRLQQKLSALTGWQLQPTLNVQSSHTQASGGARSFNLSAAHLRPRQASSPSTLGGSPTGHRSLDFALT